MSVSLTGQSLLRPSQPSPCEPAVAERANSSRETAYVDLLHETSRVFNTNLKCTVPTKPNPFAGHHQRTDCQCESSKLGERWWPL